MREASARIVYGEARHRQTGSDADRRWRMSLERRTTTAPLRIPGLGDRGMGRAGGIELERVRLNSAPPHPYAHPPPPTGTALLPRVAIRLHLVAGGGAKPTGGKPSTTHARK